MGTGVSEGPNRSMAAANAAISSPLLEDASVKGARGVIINVTGGPDLSLVEVSEASVVIQEAAHEEANIIFGAVVDPKMEGKVKITVIATGFDRPAAAKNMSPASVQTPVDLQNYSAWRQESVEKVAASAGGGVGRIAISRRQALDLPPLMAAAADADAHTAPGAEFEPVSPLDVPAFMRRQNEA
jgi:cell division protein FtsZ